MAGKTSKQAIRHSSQGFTLIELLVVIAIIGILSAIGLTSLNGAKEKARNAQRKHDLTTLRTGLLNYYDDNDLLFPETLVGADNTEPSQSSGGLGIFDSDPADNPLVPEYLSKAVVQPFSDPAFDYRYDTNQAQTGFVLYAQLEVNSLWYWLDNTGGTDSSATAHDENNCDAGDCAW